MQKKQLSVGLIGVSGYGRTHYQMVRYLEQTGQARLVCATVINPEEVPDVMKELSASQIAVYKDFQEMLAAWSNRLDLVLIPTAIHWHKDMTIAAMEAGANVLVEKPICATVQEADELIQRRNLFKKLVAVGFQDMYMPQNAVVKQKLLSGEIGRIRTIRGHAIWPRDQSYYSRNNWAGRLQIQNRWVLDSPINNACAHYVMLMLYFAGNEMIRCATPKSVQGELYRAYPIESFDTGFVKVETEEQISLYFAVTHAGAELRQPKLVIEGDEGKIVWNFENNSFVVDPNDSVRNLTIDNEFTTRKRMAETVVQRLYGEDVFVCLPEHARLHTVVVNGLHESSSIFTIPDKYCDFVTDKSKHFRYIRDIQNTLVECYRKQIFPSELGCPWAGMPGEKIALCGYRRFDGPLLRPEPANCPDKPSHQPSFPATSIVASKNRNSVL